MVIPYDLHLHSDRAEVCGYLGENRGSWSINQIHLEERAGDRRKKKRDEIWAG